MTRTGLEGARVMIIAGGFSGEYGVVSYDYKQNGLDVVMDKLSPKGLARHFHFHNHEVKVEFVPLAPTSFTSNPTEEERLRARKFLTDFLGASNLTKEQIGELAKEFAAVRLAAIGNR